MAKEKQNLKESLKKLNQIVDDLSKNDIDIDVGLTKFKQGVELIKFCKAKLKTAENQFKQLTDELEEGK
ncbi:exodeoxyribonuclease VII small subunit [Patescibacteria group bacterium]|nr:exodeoxyribonuclease VII small subunit [Patescibacteria group bacterium]